VLFGIPNSADVCTIDFSGLAWIFAVITSEMSCATVVSNLSCCLEFL
jgi:hypothetical protein